MFVAEAAITFRTAYESRRRRGPSHDIYPEPRLTLSVLGMSDPTHNYDNWREYEEGD